jgi:hypothetical protein
METVKPIASLFRKIVSLTFLNRSSNATWKLKPSGSQRMQAGEGFQIANFIFKVSIGEHAGASLEGRGLE